MIGWQEIRERREVLVAQATAAQRLQKRVASLEIKPNAAVDLKGQRCVEEVRHEYERTAECGGC